MSYQTTSLFAGMSNDVLGAALASAQTALIALQTGQSVAIVSLGSGEVTRSLTYRSTNIAGLAALIQSLQRQLGIVHRPRRAMRVIG